MSLLCLLLLMCLPSRAQQTPTQSPQQTPKTPPAVREVLPSYEGQSVSSVELAGRPDVDPRQLTPLLALRAGEPFSRAKVDQSIAALKQTGKFHDVQLEVLPEIDGIRVLFVLQPAMYYGIFQFPGATGRFSYSRLLQVTNYPPQGPYSEFAVRNAHDALRNFFRRAGYFRVDVRPEVQTEKDYGLVNLVFHVELGERAKFGDVVISGTSPEEAERLKDSLKSVMARLRRSAIRPGKRYNLRTIQNAARYLEGKLAGQGYLGARVQLSGAQYDPGTNRATISFNVQTGPKVHIEVQGAFLWPWTKKRLIPLYQQAGFNPELVQEGRQSLVSHFQSKGFFQAKVESNVQQQSSGTTVLYLINKGPGHSVESVSITGNRHIPSEQLMPAITVQKGGFLSHGKYSQNLVRDSVKNIEGLYKAAGFIDVKVSSQVSNRKGDIAVRFNVNEGRQDIVESLRIEGNDAVSQSQFAPKGLKLGPGQPYSQKLAEEDRRQIVARYLEMGYLTVNFRQIARQAGGDPHRLNVIYRIDEGPQVHTSTIFTLGRKETHQRVIDRNTAQLHPGRPLQQSDLLSASSNLYTVGIFDWAQVDPRRQITTQTQEDVVVKVHESKRNQIVYGFGFEVINRGGSVPSGTVAVPGLPPVGLPSNFKTSQKTFWGPRGSIEYTRRNLRGEAESITLSGLAARLSQRGSFTYIVPYFRGTKWDANLTASGEHNSENPIFTSRQGQGSFQLQRPLNPDRTQNIFLRYTFRETGLTRLLIPDLVPASDQHVRLSTVSAIYIRDTRDKVLDASRGIYETLEFDLNPAALGSSVDFSKFLGQVAYYKGLTSEVVWANSLRLGFQRPFAGSHVPLSEEFFSGGGSTLRGFPLNGAGPQRTIPACGTPGDPSTCSLITVPVGGNQLFILNSEFRFPHPFSGVPLPFGANKNLGFAVFYDGGNVFPAIGFHGQYTNSVGAGLRYSTPIGPVRIDVGHNLNAAPGIKSTQIFVTLGQAF